MLFKQIQWSSLPHSRSRKINRLLHIIHTYLSHPPLPILAKKSRRLLNLTIAIRKIPSHNGGILTAANNPPTVKLQLEHSAICVVCSTYAVGMGMLIRILGLLLSLLLLLGLSGCGGSALGGTRDGVHDLLVLAVEKGIGIGRSLVLMGGCVGLSC